MEDISNKIDNMIFNMQEEDIERYWKYYLVLEKDFLSTESYLAIDKDNSEGYSDIFMKLLNAICSEVDVVFKYLCKIYQPNSARNNIKQYCKIAENSFNKKYGSMLKE